MKLWWEDRLSEGLAPFFKESWSFLLHRLPRRKALVIIGIVIVAAGSAGWLFSGNDYLPLDSANTEITEEIDSGSSILKDILPRESPVAGALLFVSNLESRLVGSFSKRASDGSAGILGGPDQTSEISNLETASASALVAQGPVLAVVPSGGISEYEADSSILTYEVEAGDSLELIAESFGISVETLVGANNFKKGVKLKPGDKISILPVDGVRHVVKRGDTLDSIAAKYKADKNRILAFNGLPDNGLIKPGDELIIPGGRHVPISPKQAPAKEIPVSSLPNLTGYYGRPAGGRITQGLHPFNAADIGGRDWCNTPLYASAAGKVVLADGQGWNGGYGKYIKIAHDNGTITLYAHASQLLISEGQPVAKGQTIALMGSTGNSTGCHVHFEVRGARNPFAQ
ncbi:MAG: peptidoglycan DD-metalloendopeptidase family protein [Parcubacteria group bacterium]|nr:peptidoglycan DD-metalloendopeptidase family protein [Parcubacteria group bacterium]